SVLLALLVLGPLSPATSLADTLVTDHSYVRHDGGSDGALANCSNDQPGSEFAGNRGENEPSVAVNPDEPTFIATGSNNHCGIPELNAGWQGLYTSSDKGDTWTDSLVPGYRGDTSQEGQNSPVFGSTLLASD